MTLRSSSTEAASKCWEESFVPQGGTHSPKPRASSRRDSQGGKGSRLPVWTEGQLTSLTSGWRTWRAQDFGSLCRVLASFLRVCVTHIQARRWDPAPVSPSGVESLLLGNLPSPWFHCGWLESRENKQNQNLTVVFKDTWTSIFM